MDVDVLQTHGNPGTQSWKDRGTSFPLGETKNTPMLEPI